MKTSAFILKLFKTPLIVIVFICLKANAQQKKLFYKAENDTIVSVVDDQGKTVVAPFYTAYNYNNGEEITNDFFYILSIKEGTYAADREGKFLFYPYYFDNGPDYMWEDHTRFSDKDYKKVGMVDRTGKVVIPAQYDFLSPFHFGYAFYCLGCYFDTKIDPEHPPLVNTENHGYLNYKGEKIELKNIRYHPKDSEVEPGKFLPYQFYYNDFEKNILQQFETKKEAFKHRLSIDKGTDLTFEIISRPDEKHPYYFVKSFAKYRGNFASSYDEDNFTGNFRVSKDGKDFRVFKSIWIDKSDEIEIKNEWQDLDIWLQENPN